MHYSKKNLLSMVLIIFGLLCICIPFGADLLDSSEKEKQIEQCTAAVERMSRQQQEEEMAKVSAYNQTLNTDSPRYPLSGSKKQEYLSLLNARNDEMMGSISIPEIDVFLPVYHTTDDSVLNRGIGHLEGSSLPGGGKGNHVILFGHRGIPGSSLFTRLNELKKGDLFELDVMNQKMVYKISQIEVLSPDDLSYCQIDPDQDLVTLVTCTPFGINNKRLVVTAMRSREPEKTGRKSSYSKISMLALTGGLIILAYLVLHFIARKRKARKKPPGD